MYRSRDGERHKVLFFFETGVLCIWHQVIYVCDGEKNEVFFSFETGVLCIWHQVIYERDGRMKQKSPILITIPMRNEDRGHEEERKENNEEMT